MTDEHDANGYAHRVLEPLNQLGRKYFAAQERLRNVSDRIGCTTSPTLDKELRALVLEFQKAMHTCVAVGNETLDFFDSNYSTGDTRTGT